MWGAILKIKKWLWWCLSAVFALIIVISLTIRLCGYNFQEKQVRAYAANLKVRMLIINDGIDGFIKHGHPEGSEDLANSLEYTAYDMYELGGGYEYFSSAFLSTHNSTGVWGEMADFFLNSSKNEVDIKAVKEIYDTNLWLIDNLREDIYTSELKAVLESYEEQIMSIIKS